MPIRNGLLGAVFALACSAAPALAGTITFESQAYGGITATARPTYTTAGDPADYLLPRGGATDGVGDIILNFSEGRARCTGSLLSTGRHVLTAAHCVSNDTGVVDAQGGTVTFRGDTGNYSYNVASITKHPDYNGNYLYGNDIAVLELAAPVRSEITRYDIYRGTDEIGAIADKYGYGRSGNGNEGAILPSGTARTGQNQYETYGDFVLGALGYDYVPTSQLYYDFDNGLAANDAFGFFFGLEDLGLGASEVNAAPGDSGGPSFIDGLIAGVTSYGITLEFDDGTTSDILAGINSSFGEFGVDTRVALYAAFVDYAMSIITVPVPATLPLLGSGLLAMAALRRRRSAMI